MRSASRCFRRVLTVALFACAPFAACDETPLPGTLYGTYKVTATLQTNSCGSGLDAPDPWVFDVQVSQDGSTIYWSWMDGSAPLSGVLTTPTVNITSTTTADVDATEAGAGPCTMSRNDTVDLTFASGSPPPSFTGSIGYDFVVPSGSTCTDQLSSNGGQYTTLPCSLAYTISAQQQ